jgi:phosphatidylinositol alpha 1,6-mannosyltransferase
LETSLNSPPRVALFTDTFHEANGVATLSRHLAGFARARGLPFLVVHGGRQNSLTRDGSLETLELKRGAATFPLDKSLYCDPLLTRHKQFVIDHLLTFKPDLVHITGPGDLGFLGLWVAHILRVPLAASWHTNLHEYLSRRLDRVLHLVPEKLRDRASSAVERQSLRGLLRFYRTARFVLAPNKTLVDLLHTKTGRPAFLMAHGVDLTGYCPVPHDSNGNRPFCIGYVGRLTTEKNVRLFVDLERKLLAAGEQNYKFLIVGEGGQQKWLRKHLRSAEIPGVLRGKELASAYSHMDAFVFPSRTDTFGLVTLEAMACGVPVILAPETGEHIGIEDGVSGFLSEDFAASLRHLMHDHPLRLAMSGAARELANRKSWHLVFEQLYRTYAEGLTIEDRERADKEAGHFRNGLAELIK